jgi:two-component system chemotaxis response regulator CheY
MLTFLGKCVPAEDGLIALQKYLEAHEAKTPFDLICLDIMLPKISGIDVLKKIRKIEIENKIEKDNRVKIVMITSRDDHKTVVEAANAGCDSYLKKPLDKHRIIEELTHLGLIPT